MHAKMDKSGVGMYRGSRKYILLVRYKGNHVILKREMAAVSSALMRVVPFADYARSSAGPRLINSNKGLDWAKEGMGNNGRKDMAPG
jgi:hypothetical protein